MNATDAARPTPRIDITVDRVDDWLVFGAKPRDAVMSVTPWEALHLSAASPGSAKCVVVPGSQTVELRADVPVEDGIDIVARSRQARDGIVSLALAAIAGAKAPAYIKADNDAGAAFDQAQARKAPAYVGTDLAALVAEASWACVPRASGQLAVDLGVRGQFCQAIVEPSGTGGCRARLELARLAAAEDVTRDATAILLLTVAHLVRFVRAGAESADGMTSVFLEADIPSAATAAELHHALSALSVGGRMAGREVKTFGNHHIAIHYLAATGWAAPQPT